MYIGLGGFFLLAEVSGKPFNISQTHQTSKMIGEKSRLIIIDKRKANKKTNSFNSQWHGHMQPCSMCVPSTECS